MVTACGNKNHCQRQVLTPQKLYLAAKLPEFKLFRYSNSILVYLSESPQSYDNPKAQNPLVQLQHQF